MQERDQNTQPVSLRTLLSDSALFGLGTGLDRIIGFVVLPITAQLLGSEGFGLLSLFNTTLAIVVLACSLGLPGAFFRFYSDSSAEVNPSEIASAAFWATTGFSIALAVPLLIWAAPVSNILFAEPGVLMVALLWLRGYISSVSGLAASRLQADGKIRKFLVIQAVGTLVSRGLGIAWLILGHGIYGLLLGETVGAVLGALLLGIAGLRDLRISFRLSVMRELVGYGVSLVPGMLSIWILTATDKYLLRVLAADPFKQIGLYSIGQRVSSVLPLVTQSAFLSWRRFSFRNMHLEEGPRLIARGATLYAVGYGYITLFVCLLGNDGVHWLIGEDFAAGAAVIPVLTMAGFVDSLSPLLRVGLHQAKRPLLLSAIGILAAVLNIGLNWVLIPKYGFYGAAVATLIAQIVSTFGSWPISQRLFPIPFEYRRLTLAGAVFFGLYAVGMALDSFSWLTATVGQTAIVLSAPLLLYKVGFFMPEELSALQDGWFRVRRLIGGG